MHYTAQLGNCDETNGYHGDKGAKHPSNSRTGVMLSRKADVWAFTDKREDLPQERGFHKNIVCSFELLLELLMCKSRQSFKDFQRIAVGHH